MLVNHSVHQLAGQKCSGLLLPTRAHSCTPTSQLVPENVGLHSAGMADFCSERAWQGTVQPRVAWLLTARFHTCATCAIFSALPVQVPTARLTQISRCPHCTVVLLLTAVVPAGRILLALATVLARINWQAWIGLLLLQSSKRAAAWLPY